MRFSVSAIAAVLAAGISTVHAATHTVAVGKDGGLTFEPTSVVAPQGDIIEFELYVVLPPLSPAT